MSIDNTLEIIRTMSKTILTSDGSNSVRRLAAWSTWEQMNSQNWLAIIVPPQLISWESDLGENTIDEAMISIEHWIYNGGKLITTLHTSSSTISDIFKYFGVTLIVCISNICYYHSFTI